MPRSGAVEVVCHQVPLGALEVFDHRRGIEVEFGGHLRGGGLPRDLVVAHLVGRFDDLALAVGQRRERPLAAVVAAQPLEFRGRPLGLVLADGARDGLLWPDQRDGGAAVVDRGVAGADQVLGGVRRGRRQFRSREGDDVDTAIGVGGDPVPAIYVLQSVEGRLVDPLVDDRLDDRTVAVAGEFVELPDAGRPDESDEFLDAQGGRNRPRRVERTPRACSVVRGARR